MVKGENAFKPRECLRTIQNLFASPKYTELKIGMRAYIKLMCYCHLAGEQEITGFGRIKNGEIIDLKIPYQTVTGTTAEASDEDIMDFMRELPIDEIPEWELDWHSHCDMQAFISSTDEDNYELMSMAKGGKQFPILVVNKKGEVCCKNFIHAGKVPTIAFKLEKSELSNKEIQNIYELCKAEVIERVSMKPIVKQVNNNTWYKPTYSQSKFNYGGNYGYSKKQNADFDDGTTEEYYGFYKCQSCGTRLITAEEMDNGLCDDCLDAWINNKY